MAPNDSLSGPGAYLTDCENSACSTDCSVICLCAWPAGGSL